MSRIIFQQEEEIATFYVRDAQGNVMSTYERSNRYVSGQTYEATVKQNEISLYGSDRLGQYKPDNVLVKNLYETTNNNTPNFLEAELRTENTHLITSKQDNLPNTTPSFDITGITNFANVVPAPAQVNTILQNSIVGESSDNVAIGENLKGEMQIYSVVAKDYFGQPNVCLLYDKNGLLVQNADNIFADANSKNIITRHPTQENKYWLFSRNKLGELFRSEILVTSTQTAVTAKNIPIAATSRVGAHFTAVERRGENATILLYATRNNTATQKAEVFVVSMNATAVAVLPTIAQLPYTETDLYHGGELQISPDGKQLLWYHLGQRAAFFDYQNLKPHSFILGDNIAGVVANPAGTAIIPEFIGDLLIPVPNPLRSAFTLKTHASIDIDKVENENNIYFTQKTINNIDNLYKNSILQTGTTAGNLRRGKVSGEVRQAVGLGTGLPVQVHTLLDTPASAPIRVQASRLLRVRSFELKDHLGNVRVLVSDQKDANAAAQVQSYYNYYAFGMEMPGRTDPRDNEKYRYGFNGKENDKDFGTAGLTQDYGFRLYNPAIAKFLSVDPLKDKYPELTPYQFAGNMPIWAIDLDGLEPDKPGKENNDHEVATKKGSKEEKGYTWKIGKNNKGTWEEGNILTSKAGSTNRESAEKNPTTLTQGDLKSGDAPEYPNWMISGLNKFSRTNALEDDYTIGALGGSIKYPKTGQALIDHFFSGSGKDLAFPNGSDFSNNISNDPRFISMARKFENDVHTYFRANGNIDGFTNPVKNMDFGGLTNNLFLATTVGGTQGVKATIRLVTSDRIVVNYEIFDVYGAGLNDASRPHYIGLQSMYVLQHYRNKDNKNIYQPFVLKINCNRNRIFIDPSKK